MFHFHLYFIACSIAGWSSYGLANSGRFGQRESLSRNTMARRRSPWQVHTLWDTSRRARMFIWPIAGNRCGHLRNANRNNPRTCPRREREREREGDGERYVSGISEPARQEQPRRFTLTKNSIKYSMKYCISGFGLRSLFALAISLTRFPLWLSRAPTAAIFFYYSQSRDVFTPRQIFRCRVATNVGHVATAFVETQKRWKIFAASREKEFNRRRAIKRLVKGSSVAVYPPTRFNHRFDPLCVLALNRRFH